MSHQTEPFNVAAYGGEGWSPRTRQLSEEIGDLWAACSQTNEWAKLKAVLLHRPGSELTTTDPNAAQMLAPLDLGKAQAQHDAVAKAYRQAGITVHYVAPAETPKPNQMFVADLMWLTPEGVILARPASTVRAGEERQVARRLADIGIPLVRLIRGQGTFEGADALWLDSETVLLGRGLRTNDEGAAQINSILQEMGVAVVQVDLPFGTMHLMGMVRIVDKDLALVWPKRLAFRGVEALRERGYQVAFIPDETEAAHRSAFNVVTLAPREILMPADAPTSQAFYEDLGITCHTVDVSELRKAAGAIGCLTGVLERARP